jgi:hypothetical protein
MRDALFENSPFQLGFSTAAISPLLPLSQNAVTFADDGGEFGDRIIVLA